MWGEDGKNKTTLLYEEEAGKTNRERVEEGGREGSLVYCFCGLLLSHGSLSEKDLSLPASLVCPALPALTFLPRTPSSLSCRGPRALAGRAVLWSSSIWLTGN